MKYISSSFGNKIGMMLLFLMFGLLANAQSRKIAGQVIDDKGEPIIGANVAVKGSSGTTGTITDLDGNFTVNLPEGEKLTVSYIGYITQVITPKTNTIKITLVEDTKSLNEVVVIGYGTQKMKNVTGSVATISAEELEDLPVSNMAEALQGMINGLDVVIGSPRPGSGGSQVYVRQNRTLGGLSKDGGSTIPLIIIDDVMQLGDDGNPSMEQFNLLDPSEVESITVLRDASAAIYGSRAANGAILVKTKSSKSGVPQISYAGKFAWNDAISHSKVLKGSDFGRFVNAFAIGAGKVADYTELDNIYSDVEIAEMDNLNYDWLDKADWQTAFTQTHTLNVTGGSERATYYAGATLYDQGAYLGEQSYKR